MWRVQFLLRTMQASNAAVPMPASISDEGWERPSRIPFRCRTAHQRTSCHRVSNRRRPNQQPGAARRCPRNYKDTFRSGDKVVTENRSVAVLAAQICRSIECRANDHYPRKRLTSVTLSAKTVQHAFHAGGEVVAENRSVIMTTAAVVVP